MKTLPKKSFIFAALVMLLAPCFLGGKPATAHEQSLAGEWQLSLSSDTTPAIQNYPETIQLPGTLDEAGKGDIAAPNTIELNRRHIYNGTAWYQRNIDIPREWRGKNIELVLERTRFTKVYLDGQLVDTNTSLSTPHRITLLSNAQPGTHRLSIAVNNDTKNYPMNFSHVWSDRIQTNWNGILGQIKLIAHNPADITEVQLYPDMAAKVLRIQLTTSNTMPTNVRSSLNAQINELPSTAHDISIASGNHTQEIIIPLPDALPLWDEFTPNLHSLRLQLDRVGTPPRIISFGLRDFSQKNRQFTINKRTTILRGRLDSGVSPLTGYASMDEAEWTRILTVSKSYGINYIRFHSWCPPEAAFAAADKLGMYLQPELPAWSRFDSPGLPEYLRAEGLAILKEFGNHPSFVMLTLGNELTGDPKARRVLVEELKTKDPRRLYAQGSNNGFDAPEPNDNDDFWAVSATYREGGRVVLGIDLVRGSMLYSHLGHLNNQYPCATTHDYTRSTTSAEIPVISHETGQYLLYPDFDDIPKYTGVLVPNPLIHQKQLLEKSGMGDLAGKFHMASGKLAALCYKEDIESVLRTPDIGGFALLELQDYTGQGSGTVGMCNPFMESKKFSDPEKYRQHNSPVTPLLLLEKRSYTTAGTLKATLKIAHYGASAIRNNSPLIRITDSSGKILHEHKLPATDIAEGGLRDMGQIQIPLAKLKAPQQLKVQVILENTPWKNEYDIWLYPEKVTYNIPKDVLLTEHLNDAALSRLRNGGTIFVTPRLHDLGNTIEGQFIANFWTVAFFKSYQGPGTVGLLLDPKHSLFRHFPTEYHSNWQWFPMTRYGRPMILDDMPAQLRPLIQVIDNFETCRKLGLLFEARCGKGRLIFTSIDFLNHLDKPEVRQLMFSILRYIESPEFAPEVEVTEEQLKDLFQKAPSAPDYESAQRPGLHG